MNTIFTLAPHWLLILMITAFVAGYVDSIAGGGGMIQAPMLLLAGVPPIFALGTNKVVSMTGTTMAVVRYALKRLIPGKYAFILIVPAVIVSYLGSRCMMLVPPLLITIIILVCIPIAFFFVLKKKRLQNRNTSSNIPQATLFTLLIGFYDGFVGPGTGAYLAIMFNRVLGLDYVRATALAKPINLATNVAAVIAFVLAKNVIWTIALPMAACNFVGSYAGTYFVINKGSNFIKRVLIILLILILVANIIKLLY